MDEGQGLAVAWQETYLGGSVEEEARRIREFASEIHDVQRRNQRRAGAAAPRRAFHAKIHAGLTNAEFRVRPDLDADLVGGIFVPGAVYPATVRFSSAAGAPGPDRNRDLRGVAFRVAGDEGAVQDFLLTSAPASHARDAAQFMAAARALTRPKPLAVIELVRALGPREAFRMLQSLRQATSRPAASLASESYWSRAAFALGTTAVRFTLAAASPPDVPARRDADYLREELAQRLRRGALTFPFQAQRFVDERTTPIEDGAVEWKTRDAPPETIADLFIPQQDLATPTARNVEASVDKLTFTPWNSDPLIRPLGSLNRARKLVYEASAELRGGATSVSLPA